MQCGSQSYLFSLQNAAVLPTFQYGPAPWTSGTPDIGDSWFSSNLPTAPDTPTSLWSSSPFGTQPGVLSTLGQCKFLDPTTDRRSPIYGALQGHVYYPVDGVLDSLFTNMGFTQLIGPNSICDLGVCVEPAEL